MPPRQEGRRTPFRLGHLLLRCSEKANDHDEVELLIADQRRVRFTKGSVRNPFRRESYAFSGPTRTSCLPKLVPLSSPINACGALSRPSVTNSLYLTLPSRTHCGMSRRKSPWRAAKSPTMKPRNVRRLVRIARIRLAAHFGGFASVSL